MAELNEPVFHVRADRSAWDLRNLIAVPVAELRQYSELINNIVQRDLKVRYKRSVLGIAWTIVAPLLQMAVMWTVFTLAFRVQLPYYGVYLFAGITTWNLFLQSVVAGSHSVLGAAGLITKIRLPRVIFPLTAVVNNLVNYAFACIALLLLMLVTGAPVHWTMLLLPVMIFPLVLFAMGCAMAVSALCVFFRDLHYILEIGLGALFYATPILWDPSQIPDRFHWLLSVNPLAKYIFLAKTAVYHGTLPNLQTYAVALGIGLLAFAGGWIIFHRLQRRFIYWI